MAKSCTPPTPLPSQPPPFLWLAGAPDGAPGSGARPSYAGLKMDAQPQQRILVVDDDPAILRVWRRVLGPKSQHPSLDHLEKKIFGAPPPAPPTDAGFAIDTALQGSEGFQKVLSALAEGRPYTFAIVDMRMPPGWDGLETITRMLEKDPKLEVAICSAFSDITREEVAKRVGRSDLLWLRKPFDLEVARDLAKKLSEQGAHRRHLR